MPLVKVNDINMYYESHGEGEPLLLIAGTGSNSSQWGFMIPALSAKYRIVAFDNRDAGRSDKTDVSYSIDTMADDAIGLMDTLGIERAHILGTSMGGMIAQSLACRHPGRVNRLILAVTMMKTSPRNHYAVSQAIRHVRDGSDPGALADYTLAWSFSDQFFEQPGVAEMVRKSMLEMLNRSTLDAFERQDAATAAFDSRPWAGTIAVPTLVLAADDDITVPSGHSSGVLAKVIPGARLVTIPGGHMSFLGEPSLFLKHVTEFLASVDSRHTSGRR